MTSKQLETRPLDEGSIEASICLLAKTNPLFNTIHHHIQHLKRFEPKEYREFMDNLLSHNFTSKDELIAHLQE